MRLIFFAGTKVVAIQGRFWRRPFRRITVKVKDKDYRIVHRQGYIAN